MYSGDWELIDLETDLIEKAKIQLKKALQPSITNLSIDWGKGYFK